MAQKFFFVCAGLFLLAGAFALGARSVEAQVGFGEVAAAIITASTNSATSVYTTSGDIYAHPGYIQSFQGATPDWSVSGSWVYMGNAISEAPVTSDEQSLGGVKAQYR